MRTDWEGRDEEWWGLAAERGEAGILAAVQQGTSRSWMAGRCMAAPSQCACAVQQGTLILSPANGFFSYVVVSGWVYQ